MQLDKAVMNTVVKHPPDQLVEMKGSNGDLGNVSGELLVLRDAETIIAAELINQTRKRDTNSSCSSTSIQSFQMQRVQNKQGNPFFCESLFLMTVKLEIIL